ncbi:hypothetical protein [Tropicimonas marinistellae]|uniref:hypothetical protein n=1 Tax=Tropicimonas marinistellae TaxID=1739787 RepID=UPI00122EA4A6|nr:hypothetical protein [Tropicimonas marinistellae]
MSPKTFFFSSLGAASVLGAAALALDTPGPGPEVTTAPRIELPADPPIIKERFNENIPEQAPPERKIIPEPK